MLYVFDSSSLKVMENYYPERFPSFWQEFEQAVSDGNVVSVREVQNELAQLSVPTWLREWLKQNRDIFSVPSSTETEFVAEIFKVSHFRTLVGEQQRLKGKPVADPFIIARANIQKGCVVTEESHKPNAARIPNVCEHFSIDCTNIEGVMEREKWKF